MSIILDGLKYLAYILIFPVLLPVRTAALRY